ncbi:Ldh family oxidoreductase [Paraburkholderia sp. BR13439]|uniref:Ldh family oxidoreductase n=1 Tax=unclassified Paraburkholderia TaxID=2615204 RepID=UPI0034CFDE6B
MESSTVRLNLDELYRLACEVLLRNGMSQSHATAVAKSLVAGQRDECHSHGVYRLLTCVNALRSGKVSGNAEPEVIDAAPGLVRVDAKSTFAQVAFEKASPLLVRKAKESGIAALAINHCYHFSALWQEVEHLAEHGVAAMAMTPAHPCVAPAGGTKPLLGNNPFAFAWPRHGKNPFVFDFATSVVARGEIELARKKGESLPDGWALDENGQPTNDPGKALEGALLTFGSHKGSALSAMIELLAGPLLSDSMSFESLQSYAESGVPLPRGELILAFSLERFAVGTARENQEHAELLLDKIVEQGARLPSQRRFAARARSIADGVVLSESLYNEIRAL